MDRQTPLVENLVCRAASDLLGSCYAIALTGAGISTESNVPDFRGPQGVWTTNREAETKAYQRYELFLRDPKSYWEEMSGAEGTYGVFYSQVRKAEPNTGHYALAELEKLGLVKCIITQNIDGLHEKAGTKSIIHYHGSVDKLRCASCGARFGLDKISSEELPPWCQCGGAIKYDVVHFKEPIPSDTMKQAEAEALKCDLMLICGTSAVVYPFVALPRVLRLRGKSDAKIIEINAEPTPLTHENISNYIIQGKTGEILPAIVKVIKKTYNLGKGGNYDPES